LGQRSRKRGQRQKPAAPAEAIGTARRTTTGPAPRPRGGGRSARRDAAVRATLTPLAPGERPWPIALGAALAALTGGVQLVLFLAGVKLKVAGTHAAAGSTIAFAVIMFVCAIGMWRLRYWAVLGFMALLAIAVTNFALALLKVSSLLGLGIALAGVIIPGFLFFKLVRVLSRIQMPKFPGS
jgi:uncharacterized membrane protein (DUF2068 family)